MSYKRTLIITALSGAIAVGLGAFGAHALKPDLLEKGLLDTYQTAVQYHFYHTLALFGLALLQLKIKHKFLSLSVLMMSLGILLFSGSLYMLCLTNLRWLGAITPFGGLAFIIGWLLIAIGTVRYHTHN